MPRTKQFVLLRRRRTRITGHIGAERMEIVRKYSSKQLKKKDYWLLMCYVYKIPNRMQRLNREVRISGRQAIEYANPK